MQTKPIHRRSFAASIVASVAGLVAWLRRPQEDDDAGLVDLDERWEPADLDDGTTSHEFYWMVTRTSFAPHVLRLLQQMEDEVLDDGREEITLTDFMRVVLGDEDAFYESDPVIFGRQLAPDEVKRMAQAFRDMYQKIDKPA